MTYQFLAFVPLGPHCSEPPPCSLLFTIALFIQAFEPHVELFLKVMYRLILLLEGPDTLVEAALFGFDARVVPLRFPVFHERENELHERDLIFFNTQFRGKALGGGKMIANPTCRSNPLLSLNRWTSRSSMALRSSSVLSCCPSELRTWGDADQVMSIHSAHMTSRGSCTSTNWTISIPAEMRVSCQLVKRGSPAARCVSRKSRCGDMWANSETLS